MNDIVALGECLIDFTPSGKNILGMPLFSQNPGGAPANVLAMIAKLGGTASFIGKVGKDSFGDFLRNNATKAGIDCSNMIVDAMHPTTLAFVTLNEKGDRSFSFYRDNSADIMLEEADIDYNTLRNTKIFHFGSVSMTANASKNATISSVKKAKDYGALISYDPNYRPLLWNNEYEAKKTISSVINLCDILKVSEEEMILITGQKDIISGSKILSNFGPKIVIVTMGENGSFIRYCEYTEFYRTFDVTSIDTTGAGDAFLGAFLWKLFIENNGIYLKNLENIPCNMLSDVMMFSNAAGSLTTTKKGAIPAMPTKEEIDNCLLSLPLL